MFGLWVKCVVSVFPTTTSSRSLTQQVPEGIYKERDACLRQFLKEYPYIHNSAWKQMAATASRVPLVTCLIHPETTACTLEAPH